MNKNKYERMEQYMMCLSIFIFILNKISDNTFVSILPSFIEMKIVFIKMKISFVLYFFQNELAATVTRMRAKLDSQTDLKSVIDKLNHEIEVLKAQVCLNSLLQ